MNQRADWGLQLSRPAEAGSDLVEGSRPIVADEHSESAEGRADVAPVNFGEERWWRLEIIALMGPFQDSGSQPPRVLQCELHRLPGLWLQVVSLPGAAHEATR